MLDTTSSDVGVNTPTDEVETTAADTDGADLDTSDNADEGTDEADDGSSVPDDTDEVEYEGAKYRIPKPLKDAVLRQADYTRKTQALADARREFEAHRATSLADSKEYDEARVRAGVIGSHLEQYKNVDWAALEASDPVAAQQHWRIFSQLKDEKANADQAAASARQRIDATSQRERATRAAEVRAQLPNLIPGFNAEVDAKLAAYGNKLGYSPEELTSATLHNPVAALVLHKAMQWDEHVSKTAKSKKLTTNAQAKPAAEVGSKAVAAKDPDKMSTKEWMDWRNKAQKGRK